MAADIDHLHYFVILTTLVASTLIGLTGLYFLVRYRRRSEHDRTPRVVPTLLFEVAIITVPLGFFLTWFALGFREYIRLVTPPPGSRDVYVTPKQWMWEFAYPEGPNAIETLRVPAERPIRLIMTSRDVIHSFFVPEFRIKQDVLPGRYTVTWFEATEPGTYPILCAPSTAAPATRSCAGRWWPWRPRSSTPGWRGPDAASHSANDTPGPAPQPSADMVVAGRAFARSSRNACAATPSTARRTSAPPGWTSTAAGSACRPARPCSSTRRTSPSR